MPPSAPPDLGLVVPLTTVPERWVRPPVVAREPAPAWRAKWRFRLVAFVVLALLVALCVYAVRVLTGATAQDPGVETMRAVATAAAVLAPSG